MSRSAACLDNFCASLLSCKNSSNEPIHTHTHTQQREKNTVWLHCKNKFPGKTTVCFVQVYTFCHSCCTLLCALQQQAACYRHYVNDVHNVKRHIPIQKQPAAVSLSQMVNKLVMLLTLALEWSSYRGDWAQAPATTEIPAHSLQTQHLDTLAYNTAQSNTLVCPSTTEIPAHSLQTQLLDTLAYNIAQSQSNTLVITSLTSPTSKASICSLIRLFTSHSGMVLGQNASLQNMCW